MVRKLSVGVSDDNDAIVAQTNSNANLDLLAPGDSIQSTDVGGGWQIRSGTSQAAPHATGCAALLIEAGEVATVDELADRLTSSSVAISRGNRTFPRLECMDVESIDDFTVEPSGGDDDVWRWVLAILLLLILLSIGYWFTRRTG